MQQKKSVLKIAYSGILAFGLLFFCMTPNVIRAEEIHMEQNVIYTVDMIVSKNISSYTAGTGSVYGGSLNQQELNQVAEAVTAFMNEHQPQLLTDEQRVRIAAEHLRSNSTYAASWRYNQANTAWGNLVYHEGQCSGYARSFKALCDAMDVPCYYVKQNNGSDTGSHQWNIVNVDGSWYNIDMTEYGNLPDSIKDILYLVNDDTMKSFWEYAGYHLTWDVAIPACPNDYAAQ